MAVAQVPAGWYRDPSARHEQRYWDGQQWGAQVVDGAMESTDPPGSALPGVGTASGFGYRAVGVSAWRHWLVMLASLALVIAFMFELFVTMLALGIRSIRTDESLLYVVSWLFKPLETTYGSTSITMSMYVGYPPILLGVALIAALVVASPIELNPRAALMKAGARIGRIWSSPEDKLTWSTALHTLALSRLRIWRSSYRVWLVLAEIAALAVILLTANAMLGRTAMSTTGDVVAHLKVGLGPWVCLVAGIISAVGFALAFPLSRQRAITIHADGTIEDLPPT